MRMRNILCLSVKYKSKRYVGLQQYDTLTYPILSYIFDPINWESKKILLARASIYFELLISLQLFLKLGCNYFFYLFSGIYILSNSVRTSWAKILGNLSFTLFLMLHLVYLTLIFLKIMWVCIFFLLKIWLLWRQSKQYLSKNFADGRMALQF